MMLRLALALLLATTLPARAWLVQAPPATASTVQVLTATTSAVASGVAVRNMGLGYDASPTGTAGQLNVPWPVAGTFTNLQFSVVGGVTGAQTWQGAIVKNGVTTVISCIVDSTHNPCKISAGGSVAAQDTVIFTATPSGSPSNAVLQMTIDFTPTTAGDTVLPAANETTFSTSAAQAIGPMSSFQPGAAGSRSTNLLPEAGTVDLLTVATNAPGSGAQQYVWNVDQNASASTVTCTIAAAATSCQDTTHSFTNADGDNIEYVGTPSGTPTGALGGFAVRWRSSVLTSDFPLIATGLYTADNATVTEFWSLAGTMSATEASAQSLVNNMTVTKLEVKLPSAPGAGKSRVFTLRDNGVDTALTCTVSGASATTCTATASIVVAAGDLLGISDAPSGSPSAVHPAISLIAHR